MSATDSDVDVEEGNHERPSHASHDSISELPPSAKLVYKVLEYEDPLTQEQIAAESRLCSRTVRYALDKLEGAELVDSRVCLEDARQSKYWIPE
ncbi:MarR family transcriptional regulator [Natronobacterium texcoconense]|uniref:MarR family protein n=1 Tax=Natronobacterium texcoconense TaxID=1095778 RepID=A0A1H1F092_NATTX|nr:helix-turn-helix domain-containing protein [Natronobacterium texcoconense]SDQ94373.1 MarR family protein [Natronobacterium texcoconense]